MSEHPMSAILVELRSRMMDAISNGPLHWSDEDSMNDAIVELDRLADIEVEWAEDRADLTKVEAAWAADKAKLAAVEGLSKHWRSTIHQYESSMKHCADELEAALARGRCTAETAAEEADHAGTDAE